MPRTFEVVVGSVKVVFTTSVHRKAAMEYNQWVENSENGVGCAAGESVTLLENGEVIREHDPE